MFTVNEVKTIKTALESSLAILLQLQDADHAVHVEIAEIREALAILNPPKPVPLSELLGDF